MIVSTLLNVLIDTEHKSLITESFVSPTHKRTEGRAPVWGFKFTTKSP